MRKIWLGTILAVAFVGLMTVGCDKAMNPLADEGIVRTADQHACGNPLVVNILAGQFTDAGDVIVTNDEDNIYVKYQAQADWKFTEMHLAVGNSCEELPRNKKGHLVPGLFPYSMSFSPAVTEYEFTIPIGDWEPGDSVCIAAHSVVKRFDEYGNVIQEETGWAHHWKGCFCYVVQECYKDVSLPSDSIDMRGWHPFADSNTYWRIELDNVPVGDYNVWDGDQWKGWCAEKSVYMSPGVWYRVKLYSSQDPAIASIPRLWKNGEWDRVNWVLNHKYLYPLATWSDFQNAIWYLLGEQGNPGGLAGTIASDAMANGDGYQVPPGGWAAVLVVDGANTQLIFIEVDP